MDPLQHVNPGTPFLDAVTSDTENALREQARRFRGQAIPAGVGKLAAELVPSLTILARNDTGADASAGYIVTISSKIGDPVNEPIPFRRRPCVLGTVPAAVTDLIAILAEPIPDGEIGRVIISGGAVCDVLINDVAHTFAKPIAANATKLESTASGPARIVWKESSGATRRAFVDLINMTPAVAATDAIDLSGRTGSVADVTAAQFLRTVVSGTAGATVVTPDDASVTLPGDVNLTTQTWAGFKSSTLGFGAGGGQTVAYINSDGLVGSIRPNAVPGGPQANVLLEQHDGGVSVLNSRTRLYHYQHDPTGIAPGCEFTGYIECAATAASPFIFRFVDIGGFYFYSNNYVFDIFGDTGPRTPGTYASGGIEGIHGTALYGATVTGGIVTDPGTALGDLASLSTITVSLISDFPTLGTAAGNDTGDFLQVANDLSDLSSPATARTNLGLGTMAEENIGASGTFTTVDGKTVTVTNGVIVSIV